MSNQQFTVTGSYTGGILINETENATWTTGDTTSLFSLSNTPGTKGLVTNTVGGRIQGGTSYVTATLNSVTDIGTVICVPSDSGSLLQIRMPMSSSHWEILGLSPWESMGGLQEATGSLILSGNVGGALAPTGTILFRQLIDGVPSWDRLSVRTFDNQDGRFITATGTPNPTNGVAYLCYAKIAGAANADRVLMGQTVQGTVLGNRLLGQLGNNNGRFGVNCSGTLVTGTVDHRDTRMHPFLIVYDPVNSRVKAYSDREKITGSFGLLANVAGAVWGLSQVWTSAASFSGSYTYFAKCTGSVAIRLSDDGAASDFLRRLGWGNTLAW